MTCGLGGWHWRNSLAYLVTTISSTYVPEVGPLRSGAHMMCTNASSEEDQLAISYSGETMTLIRQI